MSTMDTSNRTPDSSDRAPVNKFALFAETLLTGVVVLVLSLPLITMPAAYAAGIAHLKRHLDGRDDSIRSLWDSFRAALPGSWKAGFVTAAAAVVIVVNLLLAWVGQLPGQDVILPVTLVVAASCAVLLLRTATAWSLPNGLPAVEKGMNHDGGNSVQRTGGAEVWREAFETGKAASTGDWTGSVLLVAALFMAAVFVWMLPALFVVVPGTLVLASAAVEFRARNRAGG
ncbi:Poxvirus protein I5 [Pseudarthrobacter sp. J64]|uniref:Poxvirus protein I5 n=1 Tax=Pseudarthrobacter sp. J64 TaxID=3116485 RepID=UPI002E803F43|nr:Poxvirus protein I5 [Pseudarthrobacter sp. J64]MEE2567831.1 Poxvirus protein I5 [Pseudarthrobacter sp. J64]